MNNIIVIKLQGGLGNQLFQYAFGLYLSKFENSKLYLDTSLLEKHHINDTLRNYELWPYSLSSEILTEIQRKNFKILNAGVFVRFLSASGLGFRNVRYINESNFKNFYKNIPCTDGHIVAHGYWQKLLYLKDIRSHILGAFYSYNNSNSDFEYLLSIIIGSNSVSIHVRRGDYISNSNAAKFHQVCDIQYYVRAINKMAEYVSNPLFFIFSDDPEWIESEFKALNCNYIIVSSKFALNHHDELFLMAHCKNNITANSSYSWWGAWANKNAEKIVIAPTVWHKNSKYPPSDLIPGEWIVI